MPAFVREGFSLHYETFGDRGRPPVMLVAGLGGAGASWGGQIERFARAHFVVLPDHRGTGKSDRPAEGYSIAQHAADMAALIAHLEIGPMHVIGTSTGGAIAQLMALDHGQTARSITMSSAFAGPDPYLRQEFTLRRQLLEHAEPHTLYSWYALLLFSPRYASEHPAAVAAWIDRAASAPLERAIALKRTDMVMAHDATARLGDIKHPTLVLCGDQDFCTPVFLSERIARAIPHAEFTVFPGGGHFIHAEMEDHYFAAVADFIARY